MRAQIKVLAQLAEEDKDLRNVEQELSEIPARAEEMSVDLQRLESLLNREKAEVEEAQRLTQLHESEIKDREEQISKTRLKAGKARNIRESDAVEGELNYLKRQIKEREDEREKLNAAIERVSQSLEQHQKEFDEFSALVREETQAARAKASELEKQKEAGRAQRDKLLAELDKDLARRYTQLRERYANPVVEVVANTCSGCRMAIPPQQLNILLRTETTEQCAYCRRIIIYPVVSEAGESANDADAQPNT